MIKRLIKSFLILLVIYVVSMTLVYSFDSTRIERHVNEGVRILTQEKLWPRFFYGGNVAGQLDNFTDKLMLEKALAQNKEFNALEKAMSINGYSRFWHGYEVLLRPVLFLFTYVEIRYLNTFIVLGLLISIYNLIKNNSKQICAIFFVLSMLSIKIFLVPMTLQFTSSIVLMAAAVLGVNYILKREGNNEATLYKFNCDELLLFSFIIGSATIFFEFLTVPILPIGMMLLYLNIYLYNNCNKVLKFFLLLKMTVFWGMGYFFTWLAKWCVATVVLPTNILMDAYNQILYRSVGDLVKKEGGVELSRLIMLKLNIKMLFLPLGNHKIVTLICIALLIFGILLWYYRKKELNKYYLKNLLFVTILPYLWYVMAANHSQVHYWFTYRSQAVSVFGILYIMYYLIDWEQVRIKFQQITRRSNNNA